MAAELPELTVADVGAWHEWLATHAESSTGVWLVLAKKGTVEPTSLSYADALDEALCFGWVDGQIVGRDAVTFRRRFTPRRAGSAWSQRNTQHVERLSAANRMRPAGLAAVDRAKADGTWDAAYAGAATIQMPEDLAKALSKHPRAQAVFERLDGANRYAVLYRVTTAKRADTRTRRIEQLVAMLDRGETPHPVRPRDRTARADHVKA